MADKIINNLRNKDSIEVKRLLATAEIQKGNYTECVGFLETLLENQPKDTEVMKKLAFCHQKLQHFDESERYL